MAIVVAVIVLAVAAALGGVALSERRTIPAGTTIGGVDVGGMTRAEATAAALPAAQARVARPIRLIGPRGEARVTGRDLGARPLLDPALDVALDAGPGERLLRHVGIGSASQIEVIYRLGPVRAAELANRLDGRFGEQPRNADLIIDADTAAISISKPAPGTLVDRAALRRGLRTLPVELGVPLRVRAPIVGVEQARVSQGVVTRLLDGPREVRFRDATAALPVATLAALVTTKPLNRVLRVGLDPAGLREELLPTLGRFERQLGLVGWQQWFFGRFVRKLGRRRHLLFSG